MSREYAIGGPLGAGYASEQTTYSFSFGQGYIAGTVPVGGDVSVSVTGQAAAISAGTVTVVANQAISIPVTGQALTASAGTVTVAGKATATVTGQAAAISAGTATVTAKAVVPVVGEQLAISAGTVNVIVGGSVVAQVTGMALSIEAGTVTVDTGAIAPPISGGGGIYWKPPSGAHIPEKELKKAIKELLRREKAAEEAKRKRPAALAREMVKAIEMIAPAGLGVLEKKAAQAFIRQGLLQLLGGYFIPSEIHDKRALENALLHLQLQAIAQLRATAEEEDEEAALLLLAAA